MDSKIEPSILDGLNYAIWAIDMETLLKSNRLWQYTKVSILDPFDAQEKFSIDGRKDELVRVIMTYISHDIWFHTSGIDWPCEV